MNVRLDHDPSACVDHDSWKSERLPVPPREVVAQGWGEVLEFFWRKAIYAAEEVEFLRSRVAELERQVGRRLHS